MNLYKTFTAITIGFLLFLSCKETKTVDPLLQEAADIQDEAIHVGMEVDSIISARFIEGAFKHDMQQLGRLKSSHMLWKQNMVVVVGADAGHDHHDHGQPAEGHDDHAHHDHDHGHSHQDVASHLTPSELKNVQLEWKSAIEAIRDSLQ